MSPQQKHLNELVGQVRSRIQTRRALRGAAISVIVLAVSLVIAAVAADGLRQKPALLMLLRILPLLLTAATVWLGVIRPLRARIGDAQIARLIEEKSRLADRFVTAVEYSEDSRDASPAIVGKLVEDASARSYAIGPDRVVDPRQAYAYGTIAGVTFLVMCAAIFVSSSPVSSGMAALYSPFAEASSANAMFINVSPGTARVPRGSDQKLKAALHGFDAEIAQIFMRKQGGEGWAANVMEPAKKYAEFQYLIFNIQDSVTYYVESGGVRSAEFTLEVADLPFVKQIDLLLNFPAYTRLADKKIENGGDVAALKGTVVHVSARLSQNAKSARIVMNDGAKHEMAAIGDNLFAGQFTVTQNGTYRIELTNVDGETYNGSNEFDVNLIEDHPPTVLIDKPGRDMKVTSIQEVFSQARAEDDYGVAAIEMYYSVNGGEEKRVQLQNLKSEVPRSLSGSHTFFLEEHALQPGDFISYYAKARDNAGSGGQESTSDIYFLEVRPFDRQFRQAQQQGGGGGGDQESNALTRKQRDIIAATFRVQREQASYTPQEKEENFEAVALSQEKLKGETETLAERIRRRLGEQLGEQPQFAKLVEYLAQAAKEMEGAITELRARKTKEAMAPEQRALQQLLRAEAIFREIQVAQGGQGGGGGEQNSQDLADLFELQLDKMKNQYETIQSQQQANQNKEKDETARRLEELSRRLQQQMEQRMRSQQQQGGGGGGSSARQQQEMIEEAERAARELERLSRDRRDQKLAEAARQMQQTADQLRRAQASSSSSNSGEAASQMQRALEQLEQARRTLESSQRAGGQQNVQDLRRRAEEALKRQDEISRNVEELARSGQSAGEGRKQQLTERKQELAEQMTGLERDIDRTAQGMGQDRQQAGDKLREAAGAIRRNRIPDRIRQNNQLIENGWLDQARERERAIKGNIEEVLKNLQAAEGSPSRPAPGQEMEDALNRARELANNLESLRRRMESQNGQDGSQQGNNQERNGQQAQGQQQNQSGQQQAQAGQQGRQPGRQQGQQARGQQPGRQQGQNSQQARGQQSGQQGQQGQQNQSGQQGQQGQQSQSGQQGQQGQQSQGQQSQSGGQNPSQSGSQEGSFNSDPQNFTGGGRPTGGARQLESELRQRLAEAEELRRSLGRDREMARELGRAIEQLRRFDPNAFSDPAQLALLKSEVIDPLRQLELELARKLQAKLGNNGPGALSDGDAPDRYRKIIEDYYRRLSVRSAEVKP